MKRIVIVGISPAAIQTAQHIRAQDPTCEILLFSLEGVLPYDRFRLPDVLSKDIKENKIFLYPEQFYKKEKIHILLDKQISRINFKRRRIYTEDKDQIDYDLLILADTSVSKLPDIKGINKSGVFSFKKLKALKEIQKAVPLTETAVIESSSIEGIKTALACQKLGRETILIVPSKYLLSDLIDGEVAAVLTGLIEEQGVQVVNDNSITEILGDSETKAVRLKSGKVLAAQLVIFPDTQPDFKLFNDSDLTKTPQGIAVDLSFRTNIENVFAIDQLAAFKEKFVDYHARNIMELEQEGMVAGKNIIGELSSFFPCLSVTSLTLQGLPIDLFGKTFSFRSHMEHSKPEESTQAHKKVFGKENKLLGTALFTAPHEKERFLKLIKDQIILSVPSENLLEGRLAQEDLMIQNESPST